LRLVAVALTVLLAACNCTTARAATARSGPAAPVTQTAGDPGQDRSGLLITINDFGADELAPVRKKFDERATAGDTEIWFRLHSTGGDVFAGLDLIQHVEDTKRAKGIHTVCVVDFYAYSMAATFLQSNACDDRLMTKRSTLLFHRVSGGASGTAKDMREAAAFMDAIDEAMAAMDSARMKISLPEFELKTDGRDWTLAWLEAVDVGAVDGLIDPTCLPAAYTLDPVEQTFRIVF
jgi:ATP-dependent protease ClpP protease subunit